MCHQDAIDSPLYSADLPGLKPLDRDCTQRTDRGDPHIWVACSQFYEFQMTLEEWCWTGWLRFLLDYTYIFALWPSQAVYDGPWSNVL